MEENEEARRERKERKSSRGIKRRMEEVRIRRASVVDRKTTRKVCSEFNEIRGQFN